MNPKVDTYLRKIDKWQEEMHLLREIILDCELIEELKWGEPCYTFKAKNVILIHGFKKYVAIMFFKGALLSDEKNVLIQQTENTQATRQIRFLDIEEIKKMKPLIINYIKEAIEIERAGLKVPARENTTLVFPDEFEDKLKENPTLKTAFEALTPGRRKGYHLFFTAAKQTATRVARIEKNISRILSGKGLEDCTCGLSKRMPSCDGSHKILVNKN